MEQRRNLLMEEILSPTLPREQIDHKRGAAQEIQTWINTITKNIQAGEAASTRLIRKRGGRKSGKV